MRIPFALDLSVGTDIVAFHRLLTPRTSPTYLQRFATRFLHPIELRELDKRFPGWHSIAQKSNPDRLKFTAHLAGRWAAKEAAKKAWGATLISFKDLRVEASQDGATQIICKSFNNTSGSLGDAEQNYASSCEQAAKLSISHDGEYAVAMVIATPLHPKILEDLLARKALATAKVTFQNV